MGRNSKNKIYAALAVWLALSGAMIGYCFKILQNANLEILSKISSQQTELNQLTAERDSYQQAKRDLDEMQTKTIQPDDFFSRDITLVDEIKTLENLGQKFGVNLDLSGLSGTVAQAPKANTKGVIYAASYSINLSGDFVKAVGFIEAFENLAFVTTLNSLSVSKAGQGNVNINMAANFYLRQQ